MQYYKQVCLEDKEPSGLELQQISLLKTYAKHSRSCALSKDLITYAISKLAVKMKLKGGYLQPWSVPISSNILLLFLSFYSIISLHFSGTEVADELIAYALAGSIPRSKSAWTYLSLHSNVTASSIAQGISLRQFFWFIVAHVAGIWILSIASQLDRSIKFFRYQPHTMSAV